MEGNDHPDKWVPTSLGLLLASCNPRDELSLTERKIFDAPQAALLVIVYRSVVGCSSGVNYSRFGGSRGGGQSWQMKKRYIVCAPLHYTLKLVGMHAVVRE